MSIRTILYPTDFSSTNLPVLELATSLAHDHDAKLIVAHVIEVPIKVPPASIPKARESLVPIAAAEQLAELEKIRPTHPAVSYEHRLLEGPPIESILTCAEKEDVDLIVMGSHGQGALKRMLLGSVADEVVRRAPCPVLTLKISEGVTAPKKIRRILFPTDLSDRSQAAIGIASSLARNSGAELDLLHVAQSALGDAVGGTNEAAAEPIIAGLKDQLEQLSPPYSDVRCSRHVLPGDPSTIIEAFAADRNADLIFMTTHGRTGLKRALMGSVAEKVLRNAACPVVTARLSLLEDESEHREDYLTTKAGNSG